MGGRCPRRPLSAAGADARACRAARARAYRRGAFRRRFRARALRSLRGRGRERRHHLCVPVARSIAGCSRRATASRSACRSSRRISRCPALPSTVSSWWRSRRTRQQAGATRRSQLDKLRDPRVKAFLVVNPSNPTAVAIDAADGRAHRRDRARAARPDPDHRRRLRAVRRGLPLARVGGAREHDRCSIRSRSTGARPGCGSASSACTSRTCSMRASPPCPRRRRQSRGRATAPSRRSPNA